MTAIELKIAKALAYDCTVHHAARGACQFVLDMGAKVYAEPDYVLSERQQAFLYSLLHRYRRQLPDLHKEHCRDVECRRDMKKEEEKVASQLVLF